MDIKKLKDLKGKKGKEMDPVHKQAKMSVVKDLQKSAEEMMGEGLKGLKKVTVASDSKEGLAHGLDKAKHILGAQEKGAPDDADMEGLEEETGEDLDHDQERGEDQEHVDKVLAMNHDHNKEHDEEMSPDEADDSSDHEHEELDRQLAELMKRKEALRSKRS